jgi:hypothetical protein
MKMRLVMKFCIFAIVLLPVHVVLSTSIGEWQYIDSKLKICPTFSKIVHDSVAKCAPIESIDIVRSFSWLIHGRSTSTSTVIAHNCTIWSVRSMGHSNRCVDHLVYEKKWKKLGCSVDVILIHFSASCVSALQFVGKRYGIRVHTQYPHSFEPVDVLRINDNGSGGSFAYLAAMYAAQAFMPQHVKSISVELTASSSSLFDSGDREFTAHGWHMWAAQYFLRANGFSPDAVLEGDRCLEYERLNAPMQFGGE